MRFPLIAILIVLIVGGCTGGATPTPTAAPRWMSVWSPKGSEGVFTYDTSWSAFVVVQCHHRLRPTEVIIGFDARYPEEDLAESVDEIYMSMRAAGEKGRWMENDWEREFHYEGSTLALTQTPAAGFIRQLSEVEELALLVTYHWGKETTTTFTFDVRYLDEALASDRGLWSCPLPN